jgi:hypothetical protein
LLLNNVTDALAGHSGTEREPDAHRPVEGSAVTCHRAVAPRAPTRGPDGGRRRPRARWPGSRTGVYMGILSMDYTPLQAKTIGVTGIGLRYA